MNILEAEDMIKGLPDQVLFQYAQNPPPQIPQFLAVSEVQRRQDMRQRFQAQQQGQTPPTVKDQILQGGIGAMGMAPEISQAPPMAPPAGPMPPAQGMAMGGVVRMQAGQTVPSQADIQRILAKPPYSRTPQENAMLRASGMQLERAVIPQEGITVPYADVIKRIIDPAGLTSFTGQILPASDRTPKPPTATAGTQRPRLGTDATSSQVLFPESAPPPAPPAENIRPPTTSGGIADVGAAMGDNRRPAGGGPLSIGQMAGELWKERGLSEQQQAVIDLINQQREAGLPAELDLEPYRQAALAREKEAREEARRTAIAGALMGLGTGLVAGDTAAGMRQATQAVTESMAQGRREASAERRSAEQLQLQAAQQARQQKIQQMQFDRESLGQIANIYSDLEKSNQQSRKDAFQILAQFNASMESNLSRLREQGALDRRAFLTALTAAEESIEDMLAADATMDAATKDRMRETLRERAIRRYGAAIPGIDVEKIAGVGKPSATGPREKPLASFTKG